MEEKVKTKKKKPILLIIGVILLIAAFIGGIYLGDSVCRKGQLKCVDNKKTKEEKKDTSKEKKEEQPKEEKIEPTKEEKKETSKESFKPEDLTITPPPADIDDKDLIYIKSLIRLDTSNGMFSFHSLEELPKGKVQDFSKADKQYIIYNAARTYGLLDQIFGETEDDFCYAGSGSCYVLKKEHYSRLAKKYNIKESFEELYSDFHIENETAYYTYGGWVQQYLFNLVNNKITKEGDNIVLTAYVNVTDYDYNVVKKAVIKYTFNKLDNGYYALYSIDY